VPTPPGSVAGRRPAAAAVVIGGTRDWASPIARAELARRGTHHAEAWRQSRRWSASRRDGAGSESGMLAPRTETGAKGKALMAWGAQSKVLVVVGDRVDRPVAESPRATAGCRSDDEHPTINTSGPRRFQGALTPTSRPTVAKAEICGEQLSREGGGVPIGGWWPGSAQHRFINSTNTARPGDPTAAAPPCRRWPRADHHPCSRPISVSRVAGTRAARWWSWMPTPDYPRGWPIEHQGSHQQHPAADIARRERTV